MSEEREIQVGDILTFHHEVFGDLNFAVLKIDTIETTNYYTMASMKPITKRRYSDKGCHWSNSEIRAWLNGEFLEGFSIKDNIILLCFYKPITQIINKIKYLFTNRSQKFNSINQYNTPFTKK